MHLLLLFVQSVHDLPHVERITRRLEVGRKCVLEVLNELIDAHVVLLLQLIYLLGNLQPQVGQPLVPSQREVLEFLGVVVVDLSLLG